MHELLHSIFNVPLDEIVAEVRRNGKWEGELHNITRNGSTVIVASRWNVLEAGGIQTGIVEIDRDITAQKRIEEGFHGLNRALESLVTDLRRAKEMFYGLLESAPEPVVISREDGEIILVNDQTEEQFGYTRDELLGQPIELLVPHSFRKRHVVHREQYLKHPTVRPLGVGHELFGLRKNGEQFPVDISLSPLTTDEGVFITSSIRDISERKEIENDLRKKNLELEQEILELKRAAGMIPPQSP
jgi:PAS domain S-box-containing protein